MSPPSEHGGLGQVAEADCYGVQRVAFVALEPGADPAEAQRLAALAAPTVP